MPDKGSVVELIVTVFVGAAIIVASPFLACPAAKDAVQRGREERHLRFAGFQPKVEQPDAGVAGLAKSSSHPVNKGKCDPQDKREWEVLKKAKVPEGKSLSDFSGVDGYDFCLTIRCNAERPEVEKRLEMDPSNPIIPADRWILICGPK